MWLDNVDCLDKELLADRRVWSNFDNTRAHIKIYANAFKNSKAFLHLKELRMDMVSENGHLYMILLKLYDYQKC